MGQADDAGRARHSAPPPPDPRATARAPAPAQAHPTGETQIVPGRHRASGSLSLFRSAGRRPLVGLGLAAVALVVVALVVGVAVNAASTPGGDRGASTSTADRGLVDWASTQLPTGATLTADPTLAAELGQAGVTAGMLSTSASVASGADGPALQVVRGAESGGRTVVARFTDDAGGELLVVDPAAVPPDAAQLDRRRQLGAALLANPMTAAPAAAAQRLRDGQVDPRLLTLLAGMAARFGIQLADLPATAGEETGSPARAAVVAAVDGAPVAEGSEQLTELRDYLAAQLDVFSPDEVQLVEGGLLLRFRYMTDPDGAVTRGGG